MALGGIINYGETQINQWLNVRGLVVELILLSFVKTFATDLI
jgi:hypothetical protein